MIPAAALGAIDALATLPRDQPLSPGKVSFARSAAVGGAVARVTTVAFDSQGGLAVAAADGYGLASFHRSRPVLAKSVEPAARRRRREAHPDIRYEPGTPAFPPLERSSLNWATRGN